MKKYIIFYCLFLYSCDNNTISYDKLKTVKDICNKNGGIKTYTLYYAEFDEMYMLDEVTCKDTAKFDTWIELRGKDDN